MSDYKELFEKRFKWVDFLKQELHEYYFPECEFIFESEYSEGFEKYSWTNFIVLKYFGELYKVNVTSYGNGGWLDIDECHITSIKKTQLVERVVTIREYV